jgi:four helix bundle protein
MASRNYRDLRAWQRSVDLAVAVYKATKRYPKDEVYGLIGQMRRSAVSVPSNIAEGQGRGSDVEPVRFLRIAHGSLRELETQLLISPRLGYIDVAQLQPILELAVEAGRLIQGLIRSKQRD